MQHLQKTVMKLHGMGMGNSISLHDILSGDGLYEVAMLILHDFFARDGIEDLNMHVQKAACLR